MWHREEKASANLLTMQEAEHSIRFLH